MVEYLQILHLKEEKCPISYRKEKYIILRKIPITLTESQDEETPSKDKKENSDLETKPDFTVPCPWPSEPE